MWGHAGELTRYSLLPFVFLEDSSLTGRRVVAVFLPQPTLIPPSETIEDVRLIHDRRELRWILIIEKDAIFQTLCSIKFGSEEGLMITVRSTLFPPLLSGHACLTFFHLLYLISPAGQRTPRSVNSSVRFLARDEVPKVSFTLHLFSFPST